MILLLPSLLIIFLSTQCLAGLQVVPTFIKLTDEQRVTTVSLKHVGKGVGQYRISLIFNRMKPDGSMEEVKESLPEERNASKYIRFSPQLAVLEPNVEQVAKIMVVAPKNLEEGEYRAHILFDPTDETEGESVGQATKDKKAIGMNLEAKMSVAVPLSFKRGKPKFTATLSDLSLLRMPNGALGYKVNIASEGNAFARGDFTAYFTPQGKEPVTVSLLRSIPSYVKQRTFLGEFTVPEGVKLSKGLLRVEYTEEEVGGEKGKLISAIEGNIP